MRIAIIGGGIAGLAGAYELEKARAAGAAVEYTLFEGRPRLGGSLASEIVNGAVLEYGPDSFLTEKPAAAELCRELGIGDQLTPSNDPERKTYVVVRNRLVPLPDGLMFLVPTKLIPTAMTRLFSLSTKIRMGLELLLPPRPSNQDESVAALVERHFGAEAVDRLADPLLSGIFGGDATQLSARTVLPKLVEMETEYGSLTRGMLAAHRAMRKRIATEAELPPQAARPFRSQAPRPPEDPKHAARPVASSPPSAAACSSWSTRLKQNWNPAGCSAPPLSKQSIRPRTDGPLQPQARSETTIPLFLLRPPGPPAACCTTLTPP